MIISALGRAAPRKPLIFNDLQQNAPKRHFFLVLLPNLRYYIYMKVREIKIRKTMIFTKARPHKMKNKILDRKQKHKKRYEY